MFFRIKIIKVILHYPSLIYNNKFDRFEMKKNQQYPNESFMRQ